LLPGFDLKARDGPAIIDFNAAATHDLRGRAQRFPRKTEFAAVRARNVLIAEEDDGVITVGAFDSCERLVVDGRAKSTPRISAPNDASSPAG
jgi:hypothetical protein